MTGKKNAKKKAKKMSHVLAFKNPAQAMGEKNYERLKSPTPAPIIFPMVCLLPVTRCAK